MNGTLVLTARVLRTIRTLPTEERMAIATAIANEIILGGAPTDEAAMSPVASMLYPLIRFDIEHDSLRFAQKLA
ncbi:MAG: hypothetical protein K2M06_08965 [Muribaculaceae bacterium]|nr:hypothetical protein [Muribaculaceae bacterium]